MLSRDSGGAGGGRLRRASLRGVKNWVG